MMHNTQNKVYYGSYRCECWLRDDTEPEKHSRFVLFAFYRNNFINNL